MISIALPLIALLVIILCKKIPVIGGKLEPALLIGALLALLTSGIYNPLKWLLAFLDGVDRFAWILCLLPVSAIYAQTQIQVGSMNSIVRLLRSILGNSRRALIACTCIALFIAGSLLGSSGAATAVIGVLVAAALDREGMPVEANASIIVMSGALGSLMPPISSSFVQSASIVGADEKSTLTIGFAVTIVAAVFVLIYCVTVFGSKKFGVSDPDDMEEREKFLTVLKEVWPTLIPVLLLITMVVLNSGFGIDVVTMLLGPVLEFLKKIPIIKGFARVLVVSIALAAAFSFFYKDVRKNAKTVFTKAFSSVGKQLVKLLCAACLLGAMYAGNQITIITEYATSLNSYALIFGGAICMIILGMITGADSVALSTILPFYGPALMALGLSPHVTAVASSCISTAGQGMPPADMTTFVVCGLLSGLLGKKIDPMKVMFYALPMCLFLACEGFFLIFTGIH